ncbi:diaminopimelate decarboxylase [Nanoarchaeota archaeon]
MVWKDVKQLENRSGILYFDGCNTLDLVKEFGTPLYVYSENRIRDNYKRLLDAYKKRYQKFKIYYAIKANNNPAVVNVLRSEGAGADASCVPEIKVAKLCGVKDEDILYSGVYNSEEELKYAIDNNTRLNIEEISQLERLRKYDIPEFLCFRINPGVGSGKFEGLIFAGPDAKFGIIEKDAKKAYEIAKKLGVKRFGVHMMTGSAILNPEYFEQVVGKLLDIAGPISKELGIQFDFIDIGGSLGIPYNVDEQPLDVDIVAESVVKKLTEKLKEYDMGEPYLIHEPGRYFVGDAGILLTNVVAIKKGYKKFIGVDAGMNTLLRPAIYGAYHHILLANNLDAKEIEKANVVGQICENTDQFAKDRDLPKDIKEGDILAILDVGAYGWGMGSQYNTRPRAAEVLVNNGNADLIREREDFDDLLNHTKIPERLKNG